MRVLLTDGSGLTSRQVAGRLAAMGHEVHALAPSRLVLTRFTRSVRRVHRAPAYGSDPWGWLDVALRISRREEVDVLFPTQEQVAVLSRAPGRLGEAGVRTAVPSFDGLQSLQDKASATRTLAAVGLRTRETSIASSEHDLGAIADFPVYLKAPIGTASTSVALARDPGGVSPAARRIGVRTAFPEGGVVVQRALAGPLVMVQAVFDDGRLVAAHANLRTREGAGGGAASKVSVDLPEVHDHLIRLGSQLGWHGALSLDAILSEDGIRYIDVNPRLVEPANALRRGPYAGSAEELTPVRADPPSVVPVAVAAASTLLRPSSYRAFTGEAVGAYALTARAWRLIVAGPP